MVLPTDERVSSASLVGGFVESTAPSPAYFAGTPPGTPSGSTAFTAMAIFRITAPPVPGVSDYICGCTDGTTPSSGWGFFYNSIGINFQIHETGGTLVSAQCSIINANMYGKLYVATATYDGTTIRPYWNGVAAVPQVPGVGGYRPLNPFFSFTIGSANGGVNAFRRGDVAAVLVSDNFVLPGANQPAAYDSIVSAIEQNRKLPFFRTPIVPGQDYVWDARDIVTGTTLPLVWTDQVSTLNISRVGNLEGYGLAARFGL